MFALAVFDIWPAGKNNAHALPVCGNSGIRAINHLHQNRRYPVRLPAPANHAVEFRLRQVLAAGNPRENARLIKLQRKPNCAPPCGDNLTKIK